MYRYRYLISASGVVYMIEPNYLVAGTPATSTVHAYLIELLSIHAHVIKAAQTRRCDSRVSSQQ